MNFVRIIIQGQFSYHMETGQLIFKCGSVVWLSSECTLSKKTCLLFHLVCNPTASSSTVDISHALLRVSRKLFK